MAKFCRKCGASFNQGSFSASSDAPGSPSPEVLVCPVCGQNLAKKSKTKAVAPHKKTEVLNVNNGQPAANPAQPSPEKETLQPLALAGKLAALQQTLPPSLTQKKENATPAAAKKDTKPPASGAKASNSTSANTSAADSKSEPANKAAGTNAAAAKAATPKAAASNAAAPNMNPKAFAALNQNTSANAPAANLPIFAALKQKKRKPKSKFFRILLLIIIAYLAFAAVYYGHKLYTWYGSIKQAATIFIADYKKPSFPKGWPISLPTAAKTPAASPSLSPAESPATGSALPSPNPAPAETSVPGANEPNPASAGTPGAIGQEPASSTQPALPAPGETATSAPAQPAPDQSATDNITIPLAPPPRANSDDTSTPAPVTAPVKPSAVREPAIQGRYAFSKADMEPNPEHHQLALEQFLKSSILIANNDGTLEIVEISNNPYHISNKSYKYELTPQTIKIMGTHKYSTGTCAIQGKCKVSETFSNPPSGNFYSPPKGKETKTQHNSKDYTLSYLGSGEIKQLPGNNEERVSISFTLNCDAEGKENNIEHSYHANGGKDTNTSNKIIDNHWNENLTLTYIKISD